MDEDISYEFNYLKELATFLNVDWDPITLLKFFMICGNFELYPVDSIQNFTPTNELSITDEFESTEQVNR